MNSGIVGGCNGGGACMGAGLGASPMGHAAPCMPGWGDAAGFRAAPAPPFCGGGGGMDMAGGPVGHGGPCMPGAGDPAFGAGFGGAMPSCGGGRPIYQGVVKGFNDEKGWGHISCDATRELYKKDIFVMRSALRGSRVAPGDTVAFTVKMGVKGAEADEVRLLQPGSSRATVNVQTVAGKAFVGRIKQYNEEKGWGFIECKETHQMFGKDIFVHKREFDAGIRLETGDMVMFLVVLGGDGRPEAKEVTPHSDSRIQAEWEAEAQAAASGQGGASHGVQGQEGGGQTLLNPNRFRGQVLRYDAEKGWGFIACEETRQMYGKDIFVHKREFHFEGGGNGDLVEFNVGAGRDGRPEALKVVRCGPVAGHNAPPPPPPAAFAAVGLPGAGPYGGFGTGAVDHGGGFGPRLPDIQGNVRSSPY